MAYSDIQNKVGQIQMANRILLAQKMNPNLTPETDLSGFQEQGGYAPEETPQTNQDVRTRAKQKRDAKKQRKVDEASARLKNKEEMEELYDGPSEETIKERQTAIDRIKGRLYGGPVEDAKRQDDMKRGDYLEDPENPFNLNTLLQIGGAAGSFIPFMGGNILRYLFGPRAMASTPQDGRTPTRLFYNAPYDNPKMFIKDKQTIEDAKKRFKWNTGIDLAGAPYSLNPQRMMLPSGQLEYAPINLRSDDQKVRQHMMIYGGKWNKPIR